MKNISKQFFNNVGHPIKVYRWWRYQNGRPKEKDAFLVTMPASGTHWVRTMLGQALVELYVLEDKIDSIRRDDLIPTYLDKSARFRYNERTEIPRIQHSHSFYSLLFRNKSIILLIRDLRDAIVSHYKVYKAARHPDCAFKNFLKAEGVNRPGQIRNNTLMTLIAFLNSWAKAKTGCKRIKVISYEKLRKKPKKELSAILEFAGLPVANEKMINRIVDFASLDNMRKMEDRNPLPQYGNRVRKVRNGIVKSYSTYFTESDREYFGQVIEKHLYSNFGYDYSSWQ
jgi:hypothetical protein